jgi:hypothetical protein
MLGRRAIAEAPGLSFERLERELFLSPHPTSYGAFVTDIKRSTSAGDYTP